MSDPFALKEVRAVPATLLRGLVRNLACGARLALFLRVRCLDFRAAPGDYVTLMAFNTLVWLLGALARASGEVRLDPAAIAVFLGMIPVILVGALVIARLYGNPALVLLLAVAFSASDLVVEVAGIALANLPLPGALRAGSYMLFFVWAWLISVRAVSVCTGAPRLQLVKGALVVTMLGVFLMFHYPKSEPWIAPADELVPSPALSGEPLFHLQGELIERALAGIAAGHDGVPELYFVGFAPDGSQDVFLREMRFVKKLFDERFAAATRSIALVSGEASLGEYPIATSTNLRRALARVGERMNVEEDVLFLFVSAHGDRRFDLAAWQPPLEQAPMNPTALARLLQDSGVKWKVVLVSACYSGGFIEPLKDANTLIITASAADRQSFGCESGRDFTYFGEAFFREGLSATRSFVDAFEQAKAGVAARETAERKTPSLPQVWIGERIAGKLRALEVQLGR